MIKFEAEKLSHQLLNVKAMSESAGGYVLASEIIEGKEQTRHIPCTAQAVRLFRKKNKATRFLAAIACDAFFYDDRIVNIRYREKDSAFDAEAELSDFLALMEGHEMFTDGHHIYNVTDDRKAAARPLCGNANVRLMQVLTREFTHIGTSFMSTVEMYGICVGYFKDDKMLACSAPVWNGSMEAKSNNYANFDTERATNLSFAIIAGRTVSRLLGYDSIEFLDIPSLMTRMKTVNIPNIPVSLRLTTDIGIRPIVALSWLLGCLTKVNTYTEVAEISHLIETLFKIGTFKKDSTKLRNILRPGVESFQDIPVKTAEEAASAQITMGVSALSYRSRKLAQILEN